MPERKPSAIIKIYSIVSIIFTLTLQLISFDEFSKNFMAVDACLYNIQIIGEAVSHLPDAVKENETEIPWLLIKACETGLFMNILEPISRLYGIPLKMIFHLLKLS